MRCVRGGACDFRIEISDPPPDPMIFQSRCPSCFFFFLVAQHRVVIKCSARAVSLSRVLPLAAGGVNSMKCR